MKLKRGVIIGIYVVSCVFVIGLIYLTVGTVNTLFKTKTTYQYSAKNVFQKTVPVIGTTEEENLIVRPYVSESVKVGKYFYDFEAEQEEQLKSIIYYENTYMQNSGVDYISDTTFDVVSVLDGEVIKVETDKTLGNIVQIKHSNDLMSVYQGVNEVKVTEGQQVNQSDVIAISGTSLINSDYVTSLHFEIYYKGELLDPENLYTLKIEDFQ